MNSNPEWFAQSPSRCRLEWGRQGARDVAARGDILVIVDTLRFSSAAVTAVQHGGILYPCLETENVAEVAQRVGAEAGGHRTTEAARYSLSPLSFLNIEPGTKVALASPNGATCARYGDQVPYLFVGALLNAAAVAGAIREVSSASSLCVSIVACGERWQSPSEDGELRMAIEDYLGAGAIISFFSGEKSSEAQVCEGAFLSVKDKLETILWECGSGRELQDKGLGEDVRFAAQLNLYDAVPILRNGRLERF